jgi:hypothetical protein
METKMKKIVTIVAVIAAGLLATACVEDRPTGDVKERRATEQLTQQAVATVGMPAVTNFTEKKMLKMLYELRDNPNYTTYTYVTDMNGKRHKICDSIGFGIPYAMQFSNPQKDIFYTSSSAVHFQMPQAEPNGLFPPSSAEGTYVMCVDPRSTERKAVPVYVEDRITVSPFPLSSVD